MFFNSEIFDLSFTGFFPLPMAGNFSILFVYGFTEIRHFLCTCSPINRHKSINKTNNMSFSWDLEDARILERTLFTFTVNFRLWKLPLHPPRSQRLSDVEWLWPQLSFQNKHKFVTVTTGSMLNTCLYSLSFFFTETKKSEKCSIMWKTEPIIKEMAHFVSLTWRLLPIGVRSFDHLELSRIRERVSVLNKETCGVPVTKIRK